jgi:hypothetical protein
MSRLVGRAVGRNPLTLNHYNGEPVTRGVNLNNQLYAHYGAYGAGENVLLDTTHINDAPNTSWCARSCVTGSAAKAMRRSSGGPALSNHREHRRQCSRGHIPHGMPDSIEILAGDPNGSFIRSKGVVAGETDPSSTSCARPPHGTSSQPVSTSCWSWRSAFATVSPISAQRSSACM